MGTVFSHMQQTYETQVGECLRVSSSSGASLALVMVLKPFIYV